MIRPTLLTAMLLTLAITPAANSEDASETSATPWMQASFETMDGESATLASAFPGKAIVVINTASRCGFTPQYEGLEKVHQEFKEKGVALVAFPSNDYGNQEPGTNEEILEFCQENYGVTFPVMAKMSTRGETISDLYAHLTGEQSAEEGEVRWNFEKFVLAADGTMIARFRSRTTPDSDEFREAIERAAATVPAPEPEEGVADPA